MGPYVLGPILFPRYARPALRPRFASGDRSGDRPWRAALASSPGQFPWPAPLATSPQPSYKENPYINVFPNA